MADTVERPAARPLRADARRNQRAILVAARQAFAELGAAATLDLVAERAGVGTATLYRRFSSRSVLLEGLVLEVKRDCGLVARRCERMPDSWQRLRALILGVAWTHRPVVPALDALGAEMPPALRDVMHAYLLGLVRAPLAQARAAGEVADDVDEETLLAFIRMLAGVRDIPGRPPATFAQWSTMADVALRGLRQVPAASQ